VTFALIAEAIRQSAPARVKIPGAIECRQYGCRCRVPSCKALVGLDSDPCESTLSPGWKQIFANRVYRKAGKGRWNDGIMLEAGELKSSSAHWLNAVQRQKWQGKNQRYCLVANGPVSGGNDGQRLSRYAAPWGPMCCRYRNSRTASRSPLGGDSPGRS